MIVGPEFDEATLWDRIWGDDSQGYLYKQTVDYAPVF